MSMLMKTADLKELYFKDIENGKLNIFLLKNLFWVSLTHYSHMRSLNGSDGRFYRNELCLDTTNGETVASYKLKDLVFTEKENKIVLLWNRILAQAKKTENYNSKFTYGLYQIDEELNTNFKNEKEETIYKYPELNGDIKIIKYLLKEYYLTEIAPTLFIYEFLK